MSNVNYNNLRSNHYAVTHNWDLEIKPDANMPSELRTPLQQYGASGGLLNIFCTQASVPDSGIVTVPINIRGIYSYQIGGRSSTVTTTSLQFYDLVDYPIFSFFDLWKDISVNRYDGSQNMDARISNGVSIILYDRNRTRKVIEFPLYEVLCLDATQGAPGADPQLQTISASLQSSNYGVVPYLSTGVPLDLLGTDKSH
jgi:hypothetical protein